MSDGLPSSTSRSQTALDALRGAILGGEFAPGERLQEVPLTERLGASRTPVRAALQRLAAEGLLDHETNRGFRVRTFPIDEIVGAYDVRAVLEGLAARTVAERGLSDAQRAILERALADGDELLAAPGFDDTQRPAYGVVNTTIHETIREAAGLRLLGDMIRLCRQVPVSSPHNIVAFQLQDVRRRHDDHHRIVDAILDGDGWRAEILMREHVAGVKGSLIRSLGVNAPSAEAASRLPPPRRDGDRDDPDYEKPTA